MALLSRKEKPPAAPELPPLKLEAFDARPEVQALAARAAGFERQKAELEARLRLRAPREPSDPIAHAARALLDGEPATVERPTREADLKQAEVVQAALVELDRRRAELCRKASAEVCGSEPVRQAGLEIVRAALRHIAGLRQCIEADRGIEQALADLGYDAGFLTHLRLTGDLGEKVRRLSSFSYAAEQLGITP
jgi:hypothetical protein